MVAYKIVWSRPNGEKGEVESPMPFNAASFQKRCLQEHALTTGDMQTKYFLETVLFDDNSEEAKKINRLEKEWKSEDLSDMGVRMMAVRMAVGLNTFLPELDDFLS